MKRKKEDAEMTRRQLLQAALRVFSEKGYAAARLEDIAEVAEVTRGAIYHHFGNKKELFICLFKERVDPFFDIMTHTLAENISPLERIRKMLLVSFRRMKEDKDFSATQKLDLIEFKLKHEIKELHEYVRERGKNLQRMVLPLIQSGMNAGELRNDIDAGTISSALFTYIAGYRFMVDVEKEEALFELDMESIVDVMINGFRKQE